MGLVDSAKMRVHFQKILLKVFKECFIAIKYMNFIDQNESYICLYIVLFFLEKKENSGVSSLWHCISAHIGPEMATKEDVTVSESFTLWPGEQVD